MDYILFCVSLGLVGFIFLALIGMTRLAMDKFLVVKNKHTEEWSKIDNFK